MSYVRETKLKVEAVTDVTNSKQDSYPSFFVYPSKLSKRTFLKAPMAHKTFSQEQFKMKFYTLGISFDNSFRNESTVLGVNNSIFVALSMRNNYTPFESNLMFLKKLRISITCTDAAFISSL